LAVAAPHNPRADFAWLWRFLMARRGQLLATNLCGILAGITTAAGPYLIGIIVDHIRQQVRMDEILAYALALIGVTAVSVLAFYGQRMLSGYVAVDVHFSVSRTIFENLLTQDQGFYQRYATGDLISRMQSDTELIWRLLALALTRGASALLTLVAAIGLLGSIHLPLTLMVIVILTISTSIQMRAGLLLAPVFEKVQEQAGDLAAWAQDAISGIQTIKTFGRESVIAKRYRDKNVEYRRRWLYFTRRNEPVGMAPNMIAELTAALVVLFGGILTLNGTLTLGNFVQFLIYLGLISQALLQLGTIYQRYQQTRGGLVRLTPLLQPTPIHDVADARPLPTPRGEIAFDRVSVQLEGQWLLRDISLHISAGKVVAFVGPTGCGKTLLVSLLARVLDPNEGRVLVDGLDIRTIRLADLRRAIAYVPQSTFLFSMPLYRNVHMDRPGITDDVLDRAIHTSRVSNDLPQLPHGLETLVGERGVMLSGGQKQRVAIARAIVRDPAILVLDDALSSVDTQTAADILGDLRQVLRSRTSLIIAHRIATVKDADWIVVMDQGRIVEQGTHTNLIAKNGMYAQMVERELHRDEDDDDHDNQN
jgi:ATP-binding cassette, subfamily B, multidrug efflux pump